MKFLIACVVAGLCAITSTLAADADGWQIPLPRTELYFQWALGGHRRAFNLEVDREARVVFGESRMEVTVAHSNPSLYPKLLESLRSNVQGGQTLIARVKGQEAWLGQFSDVSVSTDANGRFWLRGQAVIRVKRTGAPDRTQARKVAIAFQSLTQARSLRLQPLSLSITDLGPVLEKDLLAHLAPIDLPIPDCLQDEDLKITRVSLPSRAPTLEVTVSLRRMSVAAIARCVAELSSD